MKNILTLFTLLLIAGTFSSCMKDNVETITQAQDETITAQNQFAVQAKLGDEITSVDLGTSVLLAGQTIEVGTTTVTANIDPKDGHLVESITITIDMGTLTDGSGWVAGTTHIYAGSMDNAPINGGGNPQLGQFPYGSGDVAIEDVLSGLDTEDNASGVFTYTIPYGDLDIYTNASGQECFIVIIHAEVYEVEANPGNSSDPYTVLNSETAFGSGTPLNPGKGKGNGGSWAMYNEYCL